MRHLDVCAVAGLLPRTARHDDGRIVIVLER
jgi:hypothetical protein